LLAQERTGSRQARESYDATTLYPGDYQGTISILPGRLATTCRWRRKNQLTSLLRLQRLRQNLAKMASGSSDRAPHRADPPTFEYIIHIMRVFTHRALIRRPLLRRQETSFQSPRLRWVGKLALALFVAFDLVLLIQGFRDGGVVEPAPGGRIARPEAPSLEELSSALREQGRPELGATTFSAKDLARAAASQRDRAERRRSQKTSVARSTSELYAGSSPPSASDLSRSSTGSTSGSSTSGGSTSGGSTSGGSTSGGSTSGGSTSGGSTSGGSTGGSGGGTSGGSTGGGGGGGDTDGSGGDAGSGSTDPGGGGG
jgi:hypothetical protein